jgi:hypothetical protein
MLICPKCKSEYQDGYTNCSDCECELVKISEVKQEEMPVKNGSKVRQFIIGVLIILCSPMLSYKLTLMYFVPNGVGQYNNEHFIWMLSSYQYSFLLIGGIICLSCVLHWHKNYEK